MSDSSHVSSSEQLLSPVEIRIVDRMSDIPLLDAYIALSDGGSTLEVLLKESKVLYRHTLDRPYDRSLISWMDTHPASIFVADAKHIYREALIIDHHRDLVDEAAGLFA